MGMPVEQPINNGHTRAGTVGGILLVIFLRVDQAAIIHTVVLAAIGAVVSYTVSALLKYIIRKFFRK